MNTAWVHPALLLRQFSQLAVLVGGERVTAGLGAGWSTEEFAALGLELPPFRTRMDRLEEVLRLARGLYDRGAVTFEGAHVVARDLPLSPVPEQPPALLVGGGSDRVLRMAGRYADVLDLPPARAGGRRDDGGGRGGRRAAQGADHCGGPGAPDRTGAAAPPKPPAGRGTR